MNNTTNVIINSIVNLIVKHPKIWLVAIILASCASLTQLKYFEIDPSADSLLLENDPDLAFFREITERYGSEDFLLISFTPNKGIFTEESLNKLQQIKDELGQLENVSSILSILDVPLLFSPKLSIDELAKGMRTISANNVDLELAKIELVESPLYQDLLLSRDKKTTALQVSFKRDEKYFSLLEKRNTLIAKKDKGLTKDEKALLESAISNFDDYKKVTGERDNRTIVAVRDIVKKHKDSGRFSIGGANMITSDIVSFIGDDLRVFGSALIIFIIFSLLITFRHLTWVAIPLLCCVVNVILVTAALTLLNWKISIISSNYVSLILILTMSICIHLVVRYRELSFQTKNANSDLLLKETLSSMAKPCFYTTLTTVVAFLSLTFSDVQPVIVFGWIMTIGVSLALILSFLIFSIAMQYLPSPGASRQNTSLEKITHLIGDKSFHHGKIVFSAFAVFFIFSVYGITQLSVENRFIDYFKEDTEIYKGMVEIDTKLGGTTSFDIILNAPVAEEEIASEDYDPDFDDFDFDEEVDPIAESYWYSPEGLQELEGIHDYINNLPETGKVLSLATIYKVAREINEGSGFSQFELLLLYRALPKDLHQQVIGSYLSEDGKQVRIATRIIDSNKDMNRNEFIKQLTIDLREQFKLTDEQVRFSGLLVLYNNLLQSLFSSQIKTLGFVFTAIFIIFLFIFASIPVSVVAIIPNLVSATLILGFIGLIGLPLDFMTITVAAITIGIAVDDTIHYMHRFKREFMDTKNYQSAVIRTHTSIGKAMYLTSMIIIAGFSILVLSNFNPSMYFGLLTGFAMFIALASNLVLLPVILKTVKPYKT